MGSQLLVDEFWNLDSGLEDLDGGVVDYHVRVSLAVLAVHLHSFSSLETDS